jgi:dihydroxyacetone kinase-like protein
MTGRELRRLLDAALASVGERADEFRELDAAVGDGDLGVTARQGTAAVRQALADLDDSLSVSDVMTTSARAFSQASPSTMSALAAGGLLKAAKAVGEDPVDLVDAVAAGRAFFDSVSTRGKSALGDKTILDAVGPSIDALAEHAERGGDTGVALDAAIVAAQRGIDDTTPLIGQKGRARWIGERTKGNPDPGAVLYLRFLEAWRDARAG